MRAFVRTLAVASAVLATPLGAQSVQFPETEQGRLAAGFFQAVNSPDEEALMRYQEATFSEAALKRRSREQRQALVRQLRDQAGALTLETVRAAGASQLVVTARGANLPPSQRLTITFSFTSGSPLKIDQVQIS